MPSPRQWGLYVFAKRSRKNKYLYQWLRLVELTQQDVRRGATQIQNKCDAARNPRATSADLGDRTSLDRQIAWFRSSIVCFGHEPSGVYGGARRVEASPSPVNPLVCGWTVLLERFALGLIAGVGRWNRTIKLANESIRAVSRVCCKAPSTRKLSRWGLSGPQPKSGERWKRKPQNRGHLPSGLGK